MPDRRLRFVCDASDRFEVMERDPPGPVLVDLEADAAAVVGADWQRAIDRTLLDNLGKYRRYDGGSVRDLLRVLRNKVRVAAKSQYGTR
jgi:serine/threonine-protein kinase/endoribonuclease IRE1